MQQDSMTRRCSSVNYCLVGYDTQRSASGGLQELHPTLILGYGNVDRQDDGVAWHVLVSLAQRLDIVYPSSPEDEILLSHQDPDLLFVLQLTPEMAETVSEYQRVCFVDSHTGRIQPEIQEIEISAEFQLSPFTHHLTPATCLALAYTLYHSQPKAILVSIRGYEFGFSRSLSTRTSVLKIQAVDRILAWIKQNSSREERLT